MIEPTDEPAGTAAEAPSGADWRAGLDADTRATLDAKGFAEPAALACAYASLAKSHSELEGSAVARPPADAPPEAWDAFYRKLGRPDDPKDYSYALPEGLPEDLPYDASLAEGLKAWSHAAGLTREQSAKLHDAFLLEAGERVRAARVAEERRLDAAQRALDEAWGPPDGEGHQRRVELANRVIRQTGGENLVDELKAIGALDARGHVRSPRLALALSDLGEALFAEDGFYGAKTSFETNPFSDRTLNLSAQADMLRGDPERARALIRSAGLDPADYRL